MRTYPLISDNGIFFAFEIENVYISLIRITNLLESVKGVSNVKINKNIDSQDVRIEFEYKGREFMVWEPFGDNSRYWIGPEQDEQTVDVGALEKVFSTYQPPLVTKVFGDLITLNFKSLFNRS